MASTDATVENVHFRRAWLEPAEVGYRAATAALSDLAAAVQACTGEAWVIFDNTTSGAAAANALQLSRMLR